MSDMDRLAEIESLLAPDGDGGVVDIAQPLDVQALRQMASEVGARVVYVGGVGNREELLETLAVGLELPGWFGMNWDALEEVLSAPEPAQQGPLLIVWPGPEMLANADARAARVFVQIVADAAPVRRERGYGPLVLVREGSVAQEKRALDITKRPGRIHHVAVVVRDLEAALGFYRDILQLELDVVMPIDGDGVKIGFLPVGESSIELVQPTRDDTGVARFLANKGEGFHHVCLEVDDLTAELNRLSEQDVELIDSAPRRGAEGPVAFIHPRSCHGVLVELIEAPGGPAWNALGYGG
ncbi:MAG TPA: methylmalonyl-CoA epimerase [Candidatus Limnocylindria bacterium]|nr:methylmalonyl-CoA epimerase [Candidatus Limnocylindria bacterium]